MTRHVILNQAGSVGKTTTAVTLAALLAESGVPTLLWDNDAQANATRHAGAVAEPGKTVSEVLLRRARVDEVIVPSAVENLWVVPADDTLAGTAIELGRSVGAEQRIRLALNELGNRYTVVLDCPGALGILTIAALVASGEGDEVGGGGSVIAVTTPALKELEGLPRLEQTIAEVASAYCPGLSLSAIVPCMVPPAAAGQLYLDGMHELRRLYGDLVTPPVRRSVRAPEAYARGVPLTVHAPLEQITSDYQVVFDVLKARGLLP